MRTFMRKYHIPLFGRCYWVLNVNYIYKSHGYQIYLLTTQFPQHCLLSRKFHSFRGPRLQSQGSGFAAWGQGTPRETICQCYKITRFLSFFLLLFFWKRGIGIIFFFFNCRMQIRIRYLSIILKAHVFTFKHI